MKAKYVLGNCIVWLVLVMLLVTSCGVSVLKKQYPPEVLEKIERIGISVDGISDMGFNYTELGVIEVYDNPLRSWEYLAFKAKAQAYQYYGDVDVIIRATSGVESPNPPYDAERYIRGVAIRLDTEGKAFYNKWRKEQGYPTFFRLQPEK